MRNRLENDIFIEELPLKNPRPETLLEEGLAAPHDLSIDPSQDFTRSFCAVLAVLYKEAPTLKSVGQGIR